MNNLYLLNQLLSHYLVSNSKMDMYNMYICISIIYNLPTIDDFSIITIVACEQRVESGIYDKGYDKKPGNRFLKHVLVWQKGFSTQATANIIKIP